MVGVLPIEGELDPQPEPVAIVLDGPADEVAEAGIGVRRAAQRSHRFARIAQPDVDRNHRVAGGPPGVGRQAFHAGQLSRSQLGQPQVLGQPVVQLAGQARALFEHRSLALRVTQLGELDVGPPQLRGGPRAGRVSRP